jgi:hypothetical protein
MMRRISTLTWMMASLAMVGLCFPPITLASTATAAPRVVDVSLHDGGVLVGQVVDSNGMGVAGTSVTLQQRDKAVVALKTNKDGYFAAKGVPAGVYRVSADDAQGVCRLWAPKTAPATAQKGAMIVTGKGVARAQNGLMIRNMLANPWIVGGIVACAVAIPVAIANSDHDHPASP